MLAFENMDTILYWGFIQPVVQVIFLFIIIVSLITVFLGAPIVFSDKNTIKKITKLAGNVKGKKVVDLGSGDGRLVIAFAKLGAQAVGYEINPLLYLISFFKIRIFGLSRNADVRLASFWNKDLQEYNIVVIFGIGYIMSSLAKKLKKELKNGSVITVSYKLPGWKVRKSLGGAYLYSVSSNRLS